MTALKSFEGELDPPSGVTPYTGLLDGEEAKTTTGDVIKSVGQGAAEGVGFPLQFAGNIVAQGVNRGARAIGLPDPELRASNPLQGVVDYLERSKTAGGRKAVELSTPTGDVMSPSTWSLGEDASLGGYMQNIARVGGQFAVPLGVGLAGKAVKATDRAMDIAGGVSGAAQAGGAALDQEGRAVREMDEAKLRSSSPRYMDLIASGMAPGTARERIAQDTEIAAGTIGAVPAALEGTLVQRLMRGKALLPTAGKSAPVRIATAGLSGGVGEGLQEASEQVAQNIGANVGTGGDRKLTDDTFGSAVLGFAGGHLASTGIQAMQEANGKGKPAEEPPAEGEKPKKLWPFQSEGAATKRADTKTETTGEPHVVIPHPEREGRFAVVPESELQRFAKPEAADAALDKLDAQGREDIKAMRDFSQQHDPGPGSEPDVADPSRVVAEVNVLRGAKARPMSEAESLVVRRIAQGEFGEPQGLTVDELVDRGVKRGTAIGVLDKTKKAMKGLVAKQQVATINAAAHAAATSPQNDLAEPTEAQKEAGNYKKGHAQIHGMEISIENPAGSKRRPEWPELKSHYGYIRRTEGADGDHVDTFIGSKPESDRVYVVDQKDPKSGKFDEHKVMLNFDSLATARKGYLENYTKGWKGLGAITEVPMANFKAWLKDGDTKKEFATRETSNARALEGDLGSADRTDADAGATANDHAGAAVPADAAPRAPAEGADGSEAKREAKGKVGKPARVLATRVERAYEKAPRELRDVVKRVGKSIGYALRQGHSWEAAETAERALRKAGEGNKAILYLRDALAIPKPGADTTTATQSPARSVEGDEAGAAAAAKPKDTERRTDDATRKRVAEMSESEMRTALLTDTLTGIRNRRAWDEVRASAPKAVVAAIDLDSLGWLNDNMGHEAADEILRAVGEAFQREGVEAFRTGGDEIMGHFDTREEASEALGRVRALLDQATFTAVKGDQRVTKNGVGLSFGLGPDTKAADDDLYRDKAEREAAGLRPAKKAEPAGVRREPAVQAGQDRSDAAAEEVAPAPAPETTPEKSGVAVSKAPKTKRGPNKAQRARAEFKAMLENHFAEGNVVEGYGGFDRVLGFNWNGGNWSARVEEVAKRNGEWLTQGRPRSHSTRPGKNAIVARSTERAQPAAAKLSRPATPEAPKSLADFWLDFARDPDAFKYGSSTSESLDQLVKDHGLPDRFRAALKSKSYRVSAIETDHHSLPVFEIKDAASGNWEQFLTLNPDPASPEDTLFIRINDFDHLPRNVDGAQVYQMAMAWAINNGFKVNPDSDLLAVNRLRRTEAMVSTYLKYGEKAADIAPHREQYVGLLSDEDWGTIRDKYTGQDGDSGRFNQGVDRRLQALRDQLWKSVPAGATPAEKSAIFRRNLDGLLLASTSLAARRVPELANIEVSNAGDFENTVTGEHSALRGSPDLGSIGLPASALKAGVGAATARRAAVTLSALRSGSQEGRPGEGGGLGGGQRLANPQEWLDLLVARGGGNLRIGSDQARLYAKALGDKVLYSRPKAKAPERGLSASGMSTAAVHAALAPLRATWNNGPKITVLERTSQMPVEVSPDAEGAFYDGQVYLFAENLTSREKAQFTVLHETTGHYGLAGILGQRLNSTMLSIFRTNETVRSLAEQWMRNNPREETQTEEDYHALAAEEALADLAGTGMVRDQSFWRWLATTIRRALRAAGFDINISDAEVQQLLLQSRAFVEGKPTEVVQGRLAPALSAARPVWYSELERQVDASKTSSAPAAQWASTLKSMKGVKADELEWSGVLDWLGTRTGKVSRDDVVSYLSQNGVKVEETMLGGEGTATSEYDRIVVELDALGYNIHSEMDDNSGEAVIEGITRRKDSTDFPFTQGEGFEHEPGDPRFELPAEVLEYGKRLAAIEQDIGTAAYAPDGETKFRQYTLPGGKNYRELLLTLPVTRGNDVAPTFEQWWSRTHLGDMPGDDDAQMRIARRDYEREKSALATNPNTFHSSHFDQPNIVAHVRFDERTDADGKRVLFIEEFQSDWAQKGKREGFADKSVLARMEELGRLRNELASDREMPSNRIREEARWHELSREYEALSRKSQGQPAAPFVGKTESWVALAVKRMVRYAADNGFDRVAWTTGQQQADRYSLSHHVDSISWDERSEAPSDKQVFVGLKGRNSMQFIVDRRGVISTSLTGAGDLVGKNLDEVIGKAAAEKIMASEKGRLSDEGLKIGGEGMIAFYDRIVPNVVNDTLKKLGGGRVNQVTIDVTDQPPTGAGFRRSSPSQQPGFDITPEMAAQAMQGMPKFSKGFDLGALSPALQTKLADVMKTQKKLNWWHRTVGTQYHKAQINREFKPVFDASQRFVQDVSLIATDAADAAPALLPKLAGFGQTAKDFINVRATKDHERDVKAIAKAVYQGTLKDQRVYTDAELADDFKLNDRQIALYRQSRRAIEKSLDSLAISELSQLARGYAVVDPGLAKVIAKARQAATPTEALGIYRQSLQDLARSQPVAYQKEIGKTVVTLEEVVERVEKLKAEGYAPLMRFGRHHVYFYKQNAKGERETQYFALHENERDANADFRRMDAEFKDPDIKREQGVLSEESYKAFKGVSPETLELFADALGVGEDAGTQAFLRLAVSQRSALKRMIHRKGIEGYSEDVTRTLASFITSNARLASKNYHMGEMKKAAEDIRAGDVKDDALKLVSYLENPEEEAAQFRGFLFINYLGGSAASALVNASQPVTMSFPFLTQFGGAKEAAGALMNGAQVALGKGSPSADLQEALKRAGEEGVTEPAEIHQLYAESIRGVGSNIHMRRFFRLWGSAFQLAEQFNRKTTFAAAFQLAQKLTPAELKAKLPPDARHAGVDVSSPYAFASWAVHETQGIYNKANRPNWARGVIGSTLFTFKQFSISYLEFLSRLPKKQQAIALAVLMLAAGIQGLPFGDDLQDIVDSFAESLGYNFSSEKELHQFLADSLGLGEGVANWLQYGTSALPGMPLDIQGRMGLGNLIPGTSFLKKSQPNKGVDALELFGPAGGLVKSGIDAFTAMQGGRFGAAAESLAPVAVKNVVKAADMASDGHYRDARGRRVVETDAVDAIVKATGFQPGRVASEQRAIGRAMPSVALTKVSEGEIAALWAEGVYERDSAKIARAKDRLLDWNQKNPETPIRIDNGQIFRRVREMSLLKGQRTLKSASKETRGELARDLGR